MILMQYNFELEKNNLQQIELVIISNNNLIREIKIKFEPS